MLRSISKFSENGMIRVFPSNRFSVIEPEAEPLTMPAPASTLVDEDSDSPWIAVDSEFAAQRTDMYRGIRLMVLAVLNLFGGHRPTRGDDPLGGAARPFKVERLNVIADRSFERLPANREEFPYAAAA
jgi:hypothetical protein